MAHPEQKHAWIRTKAFKYGLFGAVVGLLFPIAAFLIEIAWQQLPLSLSSILVVQTTQPLIWIIESAPIVMGILAALAGRRQDLVLQAHEALTIDEAELRKMHTDLEEIVAQRISDLDRRNAQMRAVFQFGREIAEIQDLTSLLPMAAHALIEHFPWQQVEIYLLDQSGQSGFLRAAASQSGREEHPLGYRVAVGDQSSVGKAMRRGRSLVSAVQPTRPGRPPSPDVPSPVQMSIPLLTRGRVIGAVDITALAQGPMGQADTEMFQPAIDQLAAAIENVRLATESRAAMEQLQARTAQDTRAVWQDYLKGRDVGFRFSPSGMSPVSDGSVTQQPGTITVPLTLRGQSIGSIFITGRAGANWTQADQDLLEKTAMQAALALENARLLEETRQRASQEQMVGAISARLSRSLEVDAVLQSAAREFASLPDVAEAEVVLTTSNNGRPQGRERPA